MILTWVLAGLVFGGMYVFSGSLTLPIGAHITVNVAYQMVFVRTDYAGTESFSAVMRIVPDPALAFLQAGGVIDIGMYATRGLLTYLWLRFSRGRVSIDPVARPAGGADPGEPRGWQAHGRGCPSIGAADRSPAERLSDNARWCRSLLEQRPAIRIGAAYGPGSMGLRRLSGRVRKTCA